MIKKKLTRNSHRSSHEYSSYQLILFGSRSLKFMIKSRTINRFQFTCKSWNLKNLNWHNLTIQKLTYWIIHNFTNCWSKRTSITTRCYLYSLKLKMRFKRNLPFQIFIETNWLSLQKLDNKSSNNLSGPHQLYQYSSQYFIIFIRWSSYYLLLKVSRRALY